MGNLKRNAVIVTVVLFVAAAAWLNWSYGQEVTTGTETEVGAESGSPVGAEVDSELPEYTEMDMEAGDEVPGLYFSASGETSNEYFATVRINRQQARDAAVETLATVNNTDGATNELVAASLEKITKIASDTQRETELEALIMAKGFADCVVFISDEGVKVTVPAPAAGLSKVDVAKITDVVTTETGIKASELKVFEVK
ncbi:MAG: SpoIIIAH-like family protein [Oscillospiraceae bacterium]|jgi:stage III sporulation protein AH|nr:SpoIIIAH-like family protein [Oscillospiraceae bacterium]